MLSGVWERNSWCLPVFVAAISAKMDSKYMFDLPVKLVLLLFCF